METILLILENHKMGFGRLIPKKFTARENVYGKKLKNQDISDFMKKEEFEKIIKEGSCK